MAVALTITRIPQSYRPGFSRIKKLSLNDVKALSAALERAPLAGGIKGIISTIGEQVPSLKRSDVEEIVRTLYSLYVFRANAESPLPEFVSDLIGAMRASGDESLALTEDEANEFRSKIFALLDLKTAALTSKTELLKSEYTNIFEAAKILTDVRPIFAEPEEHPVGAAIIHTLKIVYHELGEHKEFFVVLDADDLQKISKVIQRANAKSESLKALLKAANLPDLS